jgi:hypothetical protein
MSNLVGQFEPGYHKSVLTAIKALFKRLLALMRGVPLVDIRQLPDDMRAALRPVVRPTTRYLTPRQAQKLIDTGCALLEDHQRIYRHRILTAKADAALGVAAAMAELANGSTAEREPSTPRRLPGAGGR